MKSPGPFSNHRGRRRGLARATMRTVLLLIGFALAALLPACRPRADVFMEPVAYSTPAPMATQTGSRNPVPAPTPTSTVPPPTGTPWPMVQAKAGERGYPTLADFWIGRAEFVLEVLDTGLPMGESDTIAMNNGELWSFLHASERSAGAVDRCGDPVPFPGCAVIYRSHDGGLTFQHNELLVCLLECLKCPCEGVRGPGPSDPGDSQFGLGLARSLTAQIDGPWEKYFGNPILVALPGNIGLGHADLMIIEGQTILYTSLDGRVRSRLALVWRSFE